jgi:hypothetical protein
MGGKGGGGGDNGQAAYYAAQQDAENKKRIADETAAFDAKTKADKAAKAQAAADKKAAADAAKAKAAADKAAADQAAADKAAADKIKAETPIGPAISAGGAIDQPETPGVALRVNSTGMNSPGSTVSLGSVLGGAVVDPPSYWVGGGAAAPRSPKASSLRTTDV